jgi:hypothetical protein
VLFALAACEGSITGGGDDEGADGADPGADGGTPDGHEPDAPAPCVATGQEVYGDGLDNDCDGIVDELRVCGDGSEPFTTLAAAVAAAPAGGGIEVCAGIYPERLVISRAIRINGAGAGVTVLDAGGGGTALVTTGHALTVSGFTVRGGNSPGEGGAIRCVDGGLTLLASAVVDNEAAVAGGGVAATRCAVRIEGTRFERNEGHDRGGALALAASTGAIVDADFSANSADYGGAIHVDAGTIAIQRSRLTGNQARVRGGGLYLSSDAVLEDSVVSQNYSGWTGGGIHIDQHAPTLQRNQINANETAWEGGGLYLHQTQAVLADNTIAGNESFDDGGGLRIFESSARLERNVIASNHAVDGDGGGFKSSHVAGLYLDNQITNNRALGAGGGMELDNDSSVVRGGVISGNRASIGGGVHVMLWPWNGGLIEDVRIVDNRAWRGGAMYLENNFQPVTVRRVTLTGNHAHQGAGIYTRGTRLQLSNALIANNSASDVGGAFYVDPSASYPWTRECPCPPVDPAADVAFSVVHGNTADAGAGAWIGAPNLTFRNSIFTGHTASAVEVAIGANPSWSYNDTFPATFGGMPDPTGSNGNLATDPAYVAAANMDFHLAAGSVCINAGDPGMTDRDGTRADLGTFGGPHAP